jgi:hypothetical protein
MISARLGGPVTADEPAGAGRLADPGGHYAVRAIPGADGAGLTLLEDDRANTIVATAAFVSEIDDIQCGIGQEPCITAAREGQTVMSGSLGSDPRWRNRGPCTRGPAGERDA